MERFDWLVTYYDIEDDVIDTVTIKDRTEHEAEREANALMPFECEDWLLIKIVEK